MKRMGAVLAVWALLVGVVVLPAVAATPEEIWAAVEKGVAWLAGQQQEDGSWPWDSWSSYADVGITAFALVKLTEYAFETRKSPFDPTYHYYTAVVKGFDFLLLNANLQSGRVWFPRGGDDPSRSWRETYSTGIAMMALSATKDPDRKVGAIGSAVDGWTYKEIVQGCVVWMAWAQDPNGGWGYTWYPYDGEWDRADNSNTGYAVLGLRYAETFGCAIPASLKTNLSMYVDYIQDTDGGSGYVDPWGWKNLLKTGNLLFEMAFVGDDASSARAQAAIGYIQNHWNDPNWDPGWKGPGWWRAGPHFQATYCLMKGFDSLGISTITVDGSPVDWFQEFADAILAVQNADGSWPSDYWGSEILGTIWALLTIERVAPPLSVAIDIKPGSFPNSINPGNRGTIPVAIFSTPTFDATARIDRYSLTFGRTGGEKSLAYRGRGVPNVGVEDVNGDGLPDLVVHFTTQLTGFQVGDTEGILRGRTYDGLKFEGRDSVRIVPPTKPREEVSGSLDLTVAASPNPVRDVHTTTFRVLGPMADAVEVLRVSIFDLSGRLVWEGEAYGSALDWHTDDSLGRYLANGIYLYRVQARVGGIWVTTQVQKLAVLR